MTRNHRSTRKDADNLQDKAPPVPATELRIRTEHTPLSEGSDVSGISEEDASPTDLRGEILALRRELRLLRIAHAELERLAVRDTLTPLFNRRHFLDALNERLERARRYNMKAAVLFIDANRLKHINDAYGHSAGDFALIHMAQIIQAQIRTSDVAARIGGDEFAIILEEVEYDQAEVKASQIIRSLEITPCLYGETPLPVSASIGLTMLRPNDSEEALIERADADMYARKRAWHGKRDETLPARRDSPDSQRSATA